MYKQRFIYFFLFCSLPTKIKIDLKENLNFSDKITIFSKMITDKVLQKVHVFF